MAAAAGAGAGGSAGAFGGIDSAAIPFITVDDDDKFEINPEAVRYLRTLTGKIAVVSIAGACHATQLPRPCMSM